MARLRPVLVDCGPIDFLIVSFIARDKICVDTDQSLSSQQNAEDTNSIRMVPKPSEPCAARAGGAGSPLPIVGSTRPGGWPTQARFWLQWGCPASQT